MNAALGYRDFVVSFDISFDGYRRSAGRILERFGPRILHSVYDVSVPATRLPGVVSRLDDLLEYHDHAVLLPRCPRCAHAWRGLPMDVLPPAGWVAR